jgi:hypothetical protein
MPQHKKRGGKRQGEEEKQQRKKQRAEDKVLANPEKAFSIVDNINTAEIASRRIIVEHWNAIIKQWQCSIIIHNDMLHMSTYIQWAIMLLAVLTHPPL